MSSRPAIVTLLTDFGQSDPYVAVMKGVMLGRVRELRIVDLTHEIEPQQVAQANFALRGAFEHFPLGTIHVVVVDPGVGSRRRILCARAAGMTFLTPDNGVLTGIVAAHDPVREVNNQQLFRGGTLSDTFSGRDIFAPVASYLAAGGAFEKVGPPADNLMVLKLPHPRLLKNGILSGSIVHVDRFGNLISNIRREDLDQVAEQSRIVSFRDRVIGPLVHSYASVPRGTPLAVLDSFGVLEIAVNGGSAAEHFNADGGDHVRVGDGS